MTAFFCCSDCDTSTADPLRNDYRLLKDLVEDAASPDMEAGVGVGAGPLSSSTARSGSTSHREHARSGLPVSPVPANGAEYRPHLGRVGADRPEIPKEEPHV